MPAALLAFGLASAVLVANSLWPVRRPGTLALIAWFPSWLVSELPLHWMITEVAVAIILIVRGGLGAWTGWIGLVGVAAAIAGLIMHLQLASTTTHLAERALKDGLGPDYQDRIEAGLRASYDPSTRMRSLALVWPWRPHTVKRTRGLVYHRAGRVALKLDVLTAAHPGERSRPAPVFLYVHGGGWVIGHKGQQGRVMMHELASAGWVCVAINYRLSPWATWPEHILDVKRGLRWVREHIAEHGGDPNFVIIAGGSAGAHLATLTALTPDAGELQREFPTADLAVQGCVALYGVYDLADRNQDFPHRAFKNLLMARVVFKRQLDAAGEEYDKASPLWHVARRGRLGAALPPFMVIHGDRDSLAPLAGAWRFRDALRGLGTRTVWLELPGANHAFELFPSLRSVPVAHAIHRFCQLVYSEHMIAQASTPAAPTTRESEPEYRGQA